MLRSISLTQFREWQIFANLEPFDEERADSRIAGVSHALVNLWKDRKRHPSDIPLGNFVVKFGDSPRFSPKKKSWQQMKSIAISMVEGFKGNEDD